MRDSANNPLTLARFELRRFRGVMPRVALLFILLIPLLYGCIYLAGNWDPYGRLGHVPVAVVNHDEPTSVNDERVAAGEDFVASLHRESTFDFIDTDEADAEKGLQEGRYYLVITVPREFSTDLVSGQTNDPQRAKIMLQRNDANGFVIGTITNSAQTSIAKAIDETAVRSYFEAVFTNLATIREGMTQASDGAAQLDAGLATAHDGSKQLRDGAGKAATGANALASGAAQLNTGATTARDGANQLAKGLDPHNTGAPTLASGCRQVADGSPQLTDTGDPVHTLNQTTGSMVTGRIDNEEYLQLFDEGMRASDTEREQIYADIQQLVYDEVLQLPLYVRVITDGYWDYLDGVYLSPDNLVEFKTISIKQ